MELYRQIYNDHPAYQKVREKEGEVYEKYISDVKFWKLKYIQKLILEQNLMLNDVLEIGCATGELLHHFFTNKIPSKIGLDISDKNIEAAKQSYPNYTFLNQDYKDFFKNNQKKIDLVILSDILEHVEDDMEMLKIAGENASYVVLNLPIEKVPEYENRQYGVNDVEGHLRAYSVEDTMELIIKANMQIVKLTVKRYVLEPVFKNYLLKKIHKKERNRDMANYLYLKEINEIEMNEDYYKMNFFALLKRNSL